MELILMIWLQENRATATMFRYNVLIVNQWNDGCSFFSFL